ncbi:DUF5686 and carboxypeptidase regulatory-like domain-containing protein [Gangjinia marincola]|uniref:DUF5686 and carboxypeptidase regulatory-like domain-containing protein n=1 Tax=Gangjinia marincola TaxID=578463 RepID=A0ABN1MEX5_9FLAO
MRALCLFLFVFLYITIDAQVTGRVTDKNNEPLPFVNVYLKDSYRGTTTNENGYFELELPTNGTFTITFQYLGFQTQQKEVSYLSENVDINITLKAESTTLQTVLIDSEDNPANAIIRSAIADRKKNKQKIDAYTADFYSRGLWRIKNAPEKILGQDLGDLGGGLDSTRSGIVYLSETVSKIKFKAPDKFNERIIASKISGNDNGVSFNSAQEANFSFYNSTIDINAQLISPIAGNAFSYYTYELEGVFYDERGNLINKIKVNPKRDDDVVFKGTIYIVEDTWQIYGVELKTTGKSIQVPIIEELSFKQSFNFSDQDSIWVKTSQAIDFSWAFLKTKGDGRFTAVYTNYNFTPDFDKNSFSQEILSFDIKANQLDSTYWAKKRPVPLTIEEQEDYFQKDSLQTIRKSKPYLDSIDGVKNKIKITSPLFGYDWQNSSRNIRAGFTSPLFVSFNTVQGFNSSTELYFTKDLEEEQGRKYWRLFSNLNYGISDDRFRMEGGIDIKFNNFSKPFLRISGGSRVESINQTDPITKFGNTVSTLFFQSNFLKLYGRQYVEALFFRDIANGVRLGGRVSFEERVPLFNTTDFVVFPSASNNYTSNNPLRRNSPGVPSFEAHTITKLFFSTRINFDQKYYSYPDGKYNVSSEKFPQLTLTYEGGIGASVRDYNFGQINGRLIQQFDIRNKGRFGYHLKAGTFINANDIAYVDFQHFWGNQTRIGRTPNYLNQFNLLPYYKLSTNGSYAEFHTEHDFKGYILNKIPWVSSLNLSLVGGAHVLYTENNKPYSEYSIGLDNIGFGKFRFLRLDYFWPYFDGWKSSNFIIGIKFVPDL